MTQTVLVESGKGHKSSHDSNDSLSVCFFAVFHCRNVHEEVVVINFVKNAVGTLAHSIPAAMKLLDSCRSGLLSK
jgi:hypothetical protein